MSWVSLEKLNYFATNFADKIAEKFVRKETGKGLSTKDYTAQDKEKLDNIAAGAEVNVQADWNVTDNTSDAFIKNKPSSLPANGGNASTVNNHTVEKNVPADAVFTDTKYTHPKSGVTAGTYRSVSVDADGHVTGGTNPNTLSGYGISEVDVSLLKGKISLENLPEGSLERLIVVANDTARFALTKSNVQMGDTVKVTATGKMYYVVDDTKLNTEAGYEVYTAGAASNVPWSGITGKPSTFTPATHNHTLADISDFVEVTEAEIDEIIATVLN